MKLTNLKRTLAVMISAGAMLVASTASSLCMFIFWEEPEMPKNLYKED